MNLTFPWTGVEKILEELHTAKTVKPLYKQETGKGFWLVGDQGVYLMANTSDGAHYKNWKEGEKLFVVYAEECDPNKVPEWYDIKRASFGGDDGVEFIELDVVKKMAANAPHKNAKPVGLQIDMTPEKYSFQIIWQLLN